MSKDKITRRKFVAGTTGAALGAMIVPRHVLGGPRYQAPSDTLNFAVIGAGGQGATDAVELVVGGQNLVAIADVDFGFVDAAMERRVRGRSGSQNPNRNPNPNPSGPNSPNPNQSPGQNLNQNPNQNPGQNPNANPQFAAMQARTQENFKKLQEAYGKAKRYADFRKMLEEQKDIDAIVVATPDHAHAVIAKAAMELGKHAYVEKPLTYTVHEARVLRETAKRKGVVTQMGNMGHSSEGARLINEWVQAGVIGPVRQVNVWTNRPIWPQGVPRPIKPAAPSDAPGMGFGNDWTQRRFNKMAATMLATEFGSVPSTLNWDLFLGPAPEVAYHPIYHPFNWRGWVDWGTGAVGDMAAHLIDHPYWALGLTYPTSIEATYTPFGVDEKGKPASYPLASKIVYRFPARGAQSPVTLTWVDGGLMAERPELLPDDVPLNPEGGVIFIGEKGILVHGTYGANPKVYPDSLMEAAQKVPKTYPRVPVGENKQALHRMNWANAIKGKEKISCPFDYAATLTETMLLGVVAMRAGQGKKILFDGEKGQITNNTDANQYLQREYRKGWSL